MVLKTRKETSKNKATKLVVGVRPQSYVSEQFRTIRTNLQYSMIDKKVKSIVITSARQGAGKSFISSNLAVTLASEQKRILLVDADFRKPSVQKIFRLKNSLGLSTLLNDSKLTTKDVVQYSRYNDLYILPSGAIPPNPSELLNSEKMSKIMNELEKDFDFIIYDMPPILEVADAQILAGKVEGTIFVLPKGQVTEEDAIKSKELLSIAGARILGAVINWEEKTDHGYYGTELPDE